MSRQTVNVYEVERPTATDQVFAELHEKILALELLPGAKLSEVEIARQYGVSRQPVRDAFNRLSNLDLLLIRPQRATVVRGFSRKRIEHSRFVRLAVELEVVKRACNVWTDAHSETLGSNIAQQIQAVDQHAASSFHTLDAQFHASICEVSGHPFVARTILENRQKTDRLCMLSLDRAFEADALIEDHKALLDCLQRNAPEAAAKVVRRHLSRLDDTIDEIQKKHSEYFEDD